MAADGQQTDGFFFKSFFYDKKKEALIRPEN
jgi:hypothetical protein